VALMEGSHEMDNGFLSASPSVESACCFPLLAPSLESCCFRSNGPELAEHNDGIVSFSTPLSRFRCGLRNVLNSKTGPPSCDAVARGAVAGDPNLPPRLDTRPRFESFSFSEEEKRTCLSSASKGVTVFAFSEEGASDFSASFGGDGSVLMFSRSGVAKAVRSAAVLVSIVI